MKFRSGLGGWVEWNAGPRWTLHFDGMLWAERLPNYLDSLARDINVAPGEGHVGNGSTYLHQDWNAWADYKAGKYFHLTLGRGKNFFGEGMRSLFLSDNAYSYPYFKLTTTVWKVRYVNLFSAMSDIRTLYDTLLPRMDAVLSFLAAYPDEAAAPPEVEALFHLALALAEVAPAVENYGQPSVVDGYDVARFVALHDQPRR